MSGLRQVVHLDFSPVAHRIGLEQTSLGRVIVRGERKAGADDHPVVPDEVVHDAEQGVRLVQIVFDDPALLVQRPLRHFQRLVHEGGDEADLAFSPTLQLPLQEGSGIVVLEDGESFQEQGGQNDDGQAGARLFPETTKKTFESGHGNRWMVA